MRTYEVILLHFRTPVHFGDAAEGGGLGDVTTFCRADTFFSALCNEAAKMDKALLKKLTDKVTGGMILFSDLMPWFHAEASLPEGDKNGGERYDLYVPRPLLTLSAEKEERPLSFSETKQFSTLRKELKKRAYIRASQMKDYLIDMKTGKQTVDCEPEFGSFVLDTHFNGRSKTPYETGSFYFPKNAGLYLILSVEEETDLEWMESLIRFVGLNGIGGRRSSGSGKFDFEDDPLLLSEDEMYGPDDAALFKMLENGKAPWHMTLSSLLPAPDEIPAAREGNGKLVKRSGFAYSAEAGKLRKENSVYMMAAGSCFKQRISGMVADVNSGTFPHPVYRLGKGLYVGLSL